LKIVNRRRNIGLIGYPQGHGLARSLLPQVMASIAHEGFHAHLHRRHID
jgi:hypothetical protein